MRLIRSLPAAAFALVVAGAFAQTGCIQSDAKTALNADGSGTQTDTMSIDIQKIKDLMEMGKAFGGGGPGGPAAPRAARVPDLRSPTWTSRRAWTPPSPRTRSASR